MYDGWGPGCSVVTATAAGAIVAVMAYAARCGVAKGKMEM
jgi:hypothetical protein